MEAVFFFFFLLLLLSSCQFFIQFHLHHIRLHISYFSYISLFSLSYLLNNSLVRFPHPLFAVCFLSLLSPFLLLLLFFHIFIICLTIPSLLFPVLFNFLCIIYLIILISSFLSPLFQHLIYLLLFAISSFLSSPFRNFLTPPLLFLFFFHFLFIIYCLIPSLLFLFILSSPFRYLLSHSPFVILIFL